MALNFVPDKPIYDFGRDVVRFMGWDAGLPVKCGVSREALMDAARIRNATEEELVKVYETFKDHIHLIAGAKYRQGRIDDLGIGGGSPLDSAKQSTVSHTGLPEDLSVLVRIERVDNTRFLTGDKHAAAAR